MRSFWLMAAVGAATMATAAPASACRINRLFDPADVRQAEVVLVGRIVRYEVVPFQKVGSTDRPRRYGDYARLSLAVDDVLVGRVPRRVTVTWINSTFALPATMKPGPYLIALRSPGAGIGVAESDAFSVLQMPCSPPFILETSGEEAAAVRRILQARKPGTVR